MQKLLENNSFILMEAAIVERLRRGGDVELHPQLVHTPLIYDEQGREQLAGIYQEYMQIAATAGVPYVMNTPTWRSNRERVAEAGAPDSINVDASQFLLSLRQSSRDASRIKIGGTLGCKNDCYLPEQGLDAAEAEQFHRWQCEQLAAGGVDFLLAATLPSVEEALGMARAMADTGLPYFISFVIDRAGRILDGTSLADAVEYLDCEVSTPPLGYMVNCSYPTFLCAESQSDNVLNRLVGYSANASSLDHCELEGAEDIQSETVSDWGNQMLSLNQKFGIQMVGGCCGTTGAHLRYLTQHMS